MNVRAPRQISRPESIQLLANLLEEVENEVTKLRTLWVKHHCTCAGKRTRDPLSVARHNPLCGYRQAME